MKVGRQHRPHLTVAVNVRLTEAQRDWLLAQSNGRNKRSVSSAIRRLIDREMMK